jgi:hypothetical protein
MYANLFRVCLAASTACLLSASPDAADASVSRGIKWLVSTQGPDGGWGQDGGATSHVRQGERLETNSNDVANTASAVLALLHAGSSPSAGEHRVAIRRGVEFILGHLEKSKEEGLAITELQGSQIQRKLGPYIDTFLTSMLLSEIDGQMGDPTLNRRVRAGLEKCVRKIEAAQLKDGSWNHDGGWAPILGTSMASRSLYQARDKGVKVKEAAMMRVDEYTKANAQQIVAQSGRPAGVGGVVGGVAGGVPMAVSGAGAGVALYDRAQTLEQLSRTEADRKANAKAIDTIAKEMSRPEMVNGFGSMGGEEYFSYLNVSDSLRRVGGEAWQKWNGEIKTKLVKLQNSDGTWAGHHCITGRVAVTSAAILTLTAERQPVLTSQVRR